LTPEPDSSSTYELVFDIFENFCPTCPITYSYDKDVDLEDVVIDSDDKLRI
jgi:hypothetical protein